MVLACLERFWVLVVAYIRGNMTTTAEASSPSLLPLSAQQLGAATELAISGITNGGGNGADAIYSEESIRE